MSRFQPPPAVRRDSAQEFAKFALSNMLGGMGYDGGL